MARRGSAGFSGLPLDIIELILTYLPPNTFFDNPKQFCRNILTLRLVFKLSDAWWRHACSTVGIVDASPRRALLAVARDVLSLEEEVLARAIPWRDHAHLLDVACKHDCPGFARIASASAKCSRENCNDICTFGHVDVFEALCATGASFCNLPFFSNAEADLVKLCSFRIALNHGWIALARAILASGVVWHREDAPPLDAASPDADVFAEMAKLNAITALLSRGEWHMACRVNHSARGTRFWQACSLIEHCMRHGLSAQIPPNDPAWTRTSTERCNALLADVVCDIFELERDRFGRRARDERLQTVSVESLHASKHLLLDKGADPVAIFKKRSAQYHHSELAEAARFGCVRIIRMLIDAGYQNDTGADGTDALWWARARGRRDAVEYLKHTVS